MAKAKKMVKPGQPAPDYKPIAVMALGAVVVVLICVFLANGLIGKVGFNTRLMAKKQIAADQLKANVSAVKTLEESYNQLGNKTQLITDALPTKPDFPGIVAMSEVIAGTSGVKLKIVTAPTIASGPAPVLTSVGPVAATPKVAASVNVVSVPLPFAYIVTVEGNYDNVLKFLANLELSARPLKLLSVKQSGTAADQTAEIQLQTYYQGAFDTSAKTEVVK